MVAEISVCRCASMILFATIKDKIDPAIIISKRLRVFVLTSFGQIRRLAQAFLRINAAANKQSQARAATIINPISISSSNVTIFLTL